MKRETEAPQDGNHAIIHVVLASFFVAGLCEYNYFLLLNPDMPVIIETARFHAVRRSCPNHEYQTLLSLNDIARTVTGDYAQINARTISEFFITIWQTYPVRQKVHLMLDGAPYHRVSLVQDWAVVMNIELHYLPSYSPNLNPIERLWKVMNEHARNNWYLATAKAFREAINGFFSDTLPEIAGKLSCRINDNFQTLKPASSG